MFVVLVCFLNLDIALLGFEGRPVYLGPTKELPGYFAKFGIECPIRQNPADFYLDVIAGKLNSDIDLVPFEGISLFLN
jgi:hypothetical protein